MVMGEPGGGYPPVAEGLRDVPLQEDQSLATVALIVPIVGTAGLVTFNFLSATSPTSYPVHIACISQERPPHLWNDMKYIHRCYERDTPAIP